MILCRSIFLPPIFPLDCFFLQLARFTTTRNMIQSNNFLDLIISALEARSNNLSASKHTAEIFPIRTKVLHLAHWMNSVAMCHKILIDHPVRCGIYLVRIFTIPVAICICAHTHKAFMLLKMNFPSLPMADKCAIVDTGCLTCVILHVFTDV